MTARRVFRTPSPALTGRVGEGDFRARALCGPGAGADPELFFPVGENGPAVLQADEAKAICSVCPVIDACLRGALERREPDGIWGGTTPSERRAMLRAAARTAHRTGEAAA